MGLWAIFSGIGSPATAAPSPAMIDANFNPTKALQSAAGRYYVIEGGTVQNGYDKREGANARKIPKLA